MRLSDFFKLPFIQSAFCLFCLFFFVDVLSAQIRVEDIKFKGNDHLSSGKLSKAIYTKANPWYRFFMPWMDSQIYEEDVFLSDLLRIERLYRQEGYLEARVQNYDLNYNSDGDEVSIVIRVEEGSATQVQDVSVTFKSDSTGEITKEKILNSLRLKPGKRYREEDLKLDHNKIVERFSNGGFPYIDAKVRPVIDREAHKVDLEWILDPGPFSYFGEITYTGNNHVADYVIQRGLGFSTHDRFSEKKLIDAQSQVYRLELFQLVNLQATKLDSRPRDIPIEVKVREAALRTLKFGVGYGTEEGFRGFTQWRHRNFLGGARILRLTSKGALHLTTKTKRTLAFNLQAELSQPYFLSNRNDLIVKPFYLREVENSFVVRRLGTEVTVNRRLSIKSNGFLTTLVERDTVIVPDATVEEENPGLYNKTIVGIGYRHDSSDQLFTPTRGRVSSFSLQHSGLILNTPYRYLRFFTEHKLYKQPASKKYVLATRVAFGAMKPIQGSAGTPVAERFFAGGSYSVRGWGRQLLGPVSADSTGNLRPIGGNSVLEGSVEYRRSIFGDFGGALFLDYGNVWSAWNGLDFTDLHYAVGAGLRYNTVIGPVRIDFAWKLNEQSSDTRNYEVHLSIGQAF